MSLSVDLMKVVIIGGGPAGLVTCKSLLDAATGKFPFDPVVLEQESDIGGTFRYRSYEVRIRNHRSTKVVARTY